jgi:hypothetical protein
MKDTRFQCKNFRREMSHLFTTIKKTAFKAEEESSTGHFWCLKTMTVNGPDSGPVSPEDCSDKRNCYLK